MIYCRDHLQTGNLAEELGELQVAAPVLPSEVMRSEEA